MSKELTKLKEKAQKVFNAWIRERDSEDGYFTCISCGKQFSIEEMDAGHYVPIKSGSIFRYDENNVHGECRYSNRFDEFHLVGYRKNLIKKIGDENVEYLENNRNLVKKWTKSELEEIIKKYGQTTRGNIANLL